MTVVEAVRIIRKELLLKDEPLKAYELLKELNMPELKEELDKTYPMVRPIFDPELYKKVYGSDGEFNVNDCEMIEPFEICDKVGEVGGRWGWIIHEIDTIKPDTYLDLACYVGCLVISAAKKGVTSYGVDMTKAAVETARDRATRKGVGGKAMFYQDDITTFNFVKGDVVSAFEVLEHVPDPKAFIKHMMDLSNGWCYLSTPDGPFGNGFGNLGHWEWDGKEEHTRGHVRVFTKATLFKLLEECGCEIAFLDAMPDFLLWAKFRRKEVKDGI